MAGSFRLFLVTMGFSFSSLFVLLLIPGSFFITGIAGSGTAYPRYTGFDGTRYDFNGFAGAHFNMYSDPAHQVNVLFEYFGAGEISFIKELGLKYGSAGTRIAVRSKPFVGKDEQLQAMVEVELDGKIMHVDGRSVATNGEIEIKMDHGASGLDNVTVTTPSLQIQCVKDGILALHLNVALKIIVPPSNFNDVHGSLGQSLRWKGRDGAVTLEGNESDYLVSGLFTDDFTFNKFLGQDAGMSKLL